jgi:hypothetical protein
VPVLSDWQLPRLTINLAYQSRRHRPAKIRVFAEFLMERFAALDLEAKWARSAQVRKSFWTRHANQPLEPSRVGISADGAGVTRMLPQVTWRRLWNV